MRVGSRTLMAVGFTLLMCGCASKKAIVTMPLSGGGSIGDELSTVTLTPCKAMSADPGSCVMKVNSCPNGIGKLKIVRMKKKLLITPYCFIPAPDDCPKCGGTPSQHPDLDLHPGTDPGSATGPVAISVEDPGDL